MDVQAEQISVSTSDAYLNWLMTFVGRGDGLGICRPISFGKIRCRDMGHFALSTRREGTGTAKAGDVLRYNQSK